MLCRCSALALALLLGPLGCAKPDSVELGGVCKQPVECKDPADTCVTVMGESLCTLACSATTPCPEDYACARMDIQVKGEGGEAAAGAQGYCLASARLGPHVATIKPKGADKKAKKRKNKPRKKKAEAGEAP